MNGSGDIIAEYCNTIHDNFFDQKPGLADLSYEGPPTFGRHCAGGILRELEKNGFVIVPVEPTQAMLSGLATPFLFWWQTIRWDLARKAYHVAISHAPTWGVR